MHQYSIPYTEVAAWLKTTSNSTGSYTHLLLESEQSLTVDEVVGKLKPYFESAHADAREAFHKYAKIDLHPDSLASTSTVQYPSSLSPAARHGVFGEVLAGLIVESFQPQVPPYKWSVPVFLFRFHADVGKYLYTLARDSSKTRQTWGRFGDDFVGLGLDSTNDVEKIIVGEAKYRNPLSQLEVEDLLQGTRYKDTSGTTLRKADGIWEGLRKALNMPEGLLQLQEILIDKAPKEYAQTILALDKLLAVSPKHTVPRTDLVIFSGVSPKKRAAGTTHIAANVVPPAYTAGRDLYVVEAFIDKGDEIIKKLYDAMWQ